MRVQNLSTYRDLNKYEQELQKMMQELEQYLFVLATEFDTKEKIYVQEACYSILTSLKQQKAVCGRLRNHLLEETNRR